VIAIIKLTFYFLILFGIASCDNPSSLLQYEQKSEHQTLDENVEKQSLEQNHFTVEELEQQQKPLLLKILELEKLLEKSEEKSATLSIAIEEKQLDISEQKETIVTLQADKQDLKSQLEKSSAEIKTLEDALTTIGTDCKAEEQ